MANQPARLQIERANCNLLRANCQSTYQRRDGSLQSCAEKNIRFDCNTEPNRSWRHQRIWNTSHKFWENEKLQKENRNVENSFYNL